MRVDPVSIRSADFPKDQKELATAFGDILNPFMSQVSLALTKNLTISENLPFELKSVQIRVDSSGIPIGNSSISTDLKNFKGYICINASSDDIKKRTYITVTSAPASSSYFVLYSALDQRQYVIWFDRSGTDLQPTVAGTFNYIKVQVLGTPTTTTVATAIRDAVIANSNAVSDFSLSLSVDIITITNTAVGDATSAFSSSIPLSNLTINNDNSGSYVISAPFLTTQVESGIVSVKHVTGLAADTLYTLVLLGIS